MATGDRRIGSSRRGMTVLGKIPSAPKPINLPSQKLENRGLDPSVEIVPKGTFSWGAGRSPPTSVSSWGNAPLASSAPVTAGAWSVVSNPQIISNSTNTAAGMVQNISRPSSAGSTRPSTAGSTRPSTAHTTTSRAWASAAKQEEQLQPSCFTLTSVDFPTLGSEKNLSIQTQHGNTSSSRPTSADMTQSRHSVFSEASLNRPTSADGTKERQSAYLDGRMHSDQMSSADETFPDVMICDSTGSSRRGTAGPNTGMDGQLEENHTVYPFARSLLFPGHGFMIGSGAYPGASFHSSSVPPVKLEDKGFCWNGTVYGAYPPNVVPQTFLGRSRGFRIHHPSQPYPPHGAITYVMQPYGMGNVPLHDQPYGMGNVSFHDQAGMGMEKARYYCSGEDSVEEKDGCNEQGRDDKPSIDKIQTRRDFHNSVPLQNHESGHDSVDCATRSTTLTETSSKVSSPSMHGHVSVIEEVPDEKIYIDENRSNKAQNGSKQVLTRAQHHFRKEALDVEIGHELQQNLKLSPELISRTVPLVKTTGAIERKSSAVPAKTIGVMLHGNKAGHLSEQNNFLDLGLNDNSISAEKANIETRNPAISAYFSSVDPIPLLKESPCGSHLEDQLAGKAYEARDNDMGPHVDYSSESLRKTFVSDMATETENTSINGVKQFQVVDCNKKEGSMNVKKKTRPVWKTMKGGKKGMSSQSLQDSEAIMLEKHVLEKNGLYQGNELDDPSGVEGVEDGNVSKDITSMAKLSLDDSSDSFVCKEEGKVGIRRKVKRKARLLKHSQRDQLHESHAWAPVKDFINEMNECHKYECIDVKETLLESTRNQLQHQQHFAVNKNNINEGLDSSRTRMEELITVREREESIQTQSVVVHTDHHDKHGCDSDNIRNSKRRQQSRRRQEETNTHGEREQWVQKGILTGQSRQERKQWQETTNKASKSSYEMQETEVAHETKYDSSLAQETCGSAKIEEKNIVDTPRKAAGHIKNHQQRASKFQQTQFGERSKQEENKVFKDEGNASFCMNRSESHVLYSINTRTISEETGELYDVPTLISEERRREGTTFDIRKHSSQQSLKMPWLHIKNNASEIPGQKHGLKGERSIQSEFFSDITESDKRAESKARSKKHRELVRFDTTEVARVNDNNKMGSHIVGTEGMEYAPVSFNEQRKQQERCDVEHKLSAQAFTDSESNKDIPSTGEKCVNSEHSARSNHTSRNRRGKKRDERKLSFARCQQTHYVSCDDDGMEVQRIVNMSEQSIAEEVKIDGSGQVSGHSNHSSKAHKLSPCQDSSHQPAIDGGTGKMAGWELKDGQLASSGKPACYIPKHIRSKTADSASSGNSTGTQRWKPRHPKM